MVTRVQLDASHVSRCVTFRREKVHRYIRHPNELLRYAHFRILLLRLRELEYAEREYCTVPEVLSFCTVLVVESDDVAASYYAGVLSGAHGWKKGRKSGGSCSRQSLSWRAPTSSIPKPVVTGFEMKSPDANPDDLVVRDRRNKDIAKVEIVR